MTEMRNNKAYRFACYVLSAKSLQQERNSVVSVLGQNDYLCKKSQKSTKNLLVLTVSLLANCRYEDNI